MEKNAYKLPPPSKQIVFESFSRFLPLSEVESLWNDTCKKLDLDKETDRLAEIDQIMLAVSKMGGTVGIAAKSMSIRIRTYQIISQTKRLSQQENG